jgi:hypothetical protein
MGRWSSRAFETYIRLPRSKMMEMARFFASLGGEKEEHCDEVASFSVCCLCPFLGCGRGVLICCDKVLVE